MPQKGFLSKALCCNILPKIDQRLKGRTVMLELNPLRQKIADCTARVETLRGYL